MQPIIVVLELQSLAARRHSGDCHALAAGRRRGIAATAYRRLCTWIGDSVGYLRATYFRTELAQIQLDAGDSRGEKLQLHRVQDNEFAVGVIKGNVEGVIANLDPGLARISVGHGLG